MLNRVLMTAMLGAALMLTGCGGEETTTNGDNSNGGGDAAPTNAPVDMKAMADKAKEALGKFNEVAAKITDKASAEANKDGLMGAFESVKKAMAGFDMKKFMADNPIEGLSFGKLQKTAMDHIQRLMGNEQIKSVLGALKLE